MLLRARHPGWRRLVAAVALGPLAAPVGAVCVDSPSVWRGLADILSNPLELLFVIPVHAVGYPATILFGLPVVLVLARWTVAGFIPVMAAGAAFGALCWAVFGTFGAGEAMFVSSLAATSACWLIAFLANPRARVPEKRR